MRNLISMKRHPYLKKDDTSVLWFNKSDTMNEWQSSLDGWEEDENLKVEAGWRRYKKDKTKTIISEYFD